VTGVPRLPVVALALCVASTTGAAQPPTPQPAAVAPAAPVLWRDPGPIGEKDLHWGVGSAARQPQPPFTFIKEDLSGSKPKVRVRDAAGVEWNVKLAGPAAEKNEVHPEVAANRLAGALGYFAEEDYFIAAGTIDGVRDLDRARDAIARDGTFRVARFERREPDTVRSDRTWSLDDNPFVDTKELSGLKILLALVNNWDNKPDNTAIDRVPAAGGFEDRYLFSDWGASFGRMSGPPDWSPAPTRWRLEHYQQQPLTRGVADNRVKLHFIGQVPMDAVPRDHAAWFVELAGQLSIEQVRAAFEAAGASPRDATAFAQRVLDKIAELRSAVQSSAF
jgi:hypothetical protein